MIGMFGGTTHAMLVVIYWFASYLLVYVLCNGRKLVVEPEQTRVRRSLRFLFLAHNQVETPGTDQILGKI